MHILLRIFKLIFKLNSLIKSLRKKIHFFKNAIPTSIFQTYFGCALSIPNDFRAIFWIQTWIFDIFQKSVKTAFCSIFRYQLRTFHFFFPDRPIWPNHYWGCAEMLLHTYHDPISCLDRKIEFAKFFFQISLFMHILLRETLKRPLRSCFQLI